MQQEVTAGVLLTNALVLGIVALGISHWVGAGFKLWRREPLVAWEPRRSAPWGLFDLIVAVVLVLGGTIVVARLMQVFGWLPAELVIKDATPRQTALLILADGGSRLLVMPLLLLLVAVRTGATAKDLGFVPSKLLSDIRLGAIAFTMLLPLVFLIQAILTRYQKYEHELINVLNELPDWRWAVAMVFVAGVSAPIAEEILFRLLLQGWIEKFFGFKGPTHELVLGAMRGRHVQLGAGVDAPFNHPDSMPAAEVVGHVDRQPSNSNPYLPPRGIAAGDLSDSPDQPSLAYDSQTETVPPALRRWGWIAIVISAIIFAGLHWSHGPAWVALTVLAAGMGYLYQRTHRIVPSLVVHAMLNNLTMIIVLFNPEAGS